MKTPTYVPLSKAYHHESQFNKSLAQNINLLEIGSFADEADVEALVGTRKADILAKGNDGTLVVECQFGVADWDHWGRLEAYARIKKASAAALVAESFEPLMIQTCTLRNQQDKSIDWFLIKALVTEDHLHVFQTVSGPAIDIQAENTGKMTSEFWKPIREKGLFAGKQVPDGTSWVSKGIKGAGIDLIVNNKNAKVNIYFKGKDMVQRRDKALEVLSAIPHEKLTNETDKFAFIIFPVLDKGMKDKKYWDIIRSKLVQVGTDVYNTLKDADF